MTNVVWTDSHCHLTYDGVDSDAVASAAAAGVTRIVTIGTDASSSQASVEAARSFDGVYATVGLHPHEAVHGVSTLDDLLSPPDEKVVGIGECGLDYYYEHSPREAQREAFAAQIELARRLDLTLVVHTRDAWDDTFSLLGSGSMPERWIVHCFSGGPAEARRALDMGAYLSFSGIVTFKKAVEVAEAATMCPLDRLLVETDSPYLAPVPNRGKANQPAWVALVGAAVADLKGLPVEEVAQATWDNTTAAFGLPSALPA
ncbi:MAG TPA: TatD family hydrolase [Acidimicrobiales bacterium]|nr:TatD family hydrolase [Acidimicrobiales bacterium]